MRNFDDYLSEARRKTGVASNNGIAKLLDISGPSLSSLFQGKSLPSEDTMVKLADLAGIDRETALLDLAVWRSSGNENVKKTWLSLANKLALL